jgi:hypothetical protein
MNAGPQQRRRKTLFGIEALVLRAAPVPVEAYFREGSVRLLHHHRALARQSMRTAK